MEQAVGALTPEFTRLPDLASRSVGGSVVWANDELFAERENLIKAATPEHAAQVFGHKGQVYDGWETRRRREAGHDSAVVRLGLPGVVRGIIVDTAFFTGNFPPEISVEACAVEGYPSPVELADTHWTELVPRSPVAGNTANAFTVEAAARFTHVRLSLFPDGGVARLRVHGDVVADPRLFIGATVDLAALENGAYITGCSNMFYSSPANLISPGPARTMGDGWETARRRDAGNDWVEICLAGPGIIRLAELDTTHFVGNAPGWAALSGYDARGADAGGNELRWRPILERTRLQPDTRHRFRLEPGAEVTHVRLDVFPDGGMGRLRLVGDLAPSGREELALRWFNLLPESHLAELMATAGAGRSQLAAALAARPLERFVDMPESVRTMVSS